MRTFFLGVALVVLAAATAAGQVVSETQAPMPVSAAQRSFEAGQYDQALLSIAQARERGEAGGPAEAFLAAHAQMRRMQNEAAKGEFNRLIESGDDIWRQVAESSHAFIDQNLDHALAVASQAVAQINERNAQSAAAAGGQLPAQDPDARMRDFAAFYQLGLVKARREDWGGAAEAFERAMQLNPSFAYAHYYAGLAYSRMRRSDRTVAHFDVFLKLAPSAPERGAVASILRTLRGN
jgi:tetratricopeptide (TPR) repeat protein